MSARSSGATAVRRPSGARTPSRTPSRRPARGRTPRRAGRRPQGRRTPGSRLASWTWLALLVVVVALLALSWNGAGRGGPMATAECTLPVTGVELTGEQIGHARTIAQVGRDRGLPERAVVIALATAMQESSLRNLDHGDRDSLGLFQQRPSQGWGTPEQVQDPVYAAGIFYDRLVQVPGWETMRLTDAGQRVQRSGHPEAYQKHEGMAVELTTALAVDAPLCG